MDEYQYSVKMSDGTRYDFEDRYLLSKEGGWMAFRKGKNEIHLNVVHIVSITVTGGCDDS